LNHLCQGKMDHIDPSKISYNFDDFHISDTCTHDIDDY
jgi:hypothetical protein